MLIASYRRGTVHYQRCGSTQPGAFPAISATALPGAAPILRRHGFLEKIMMPDVPVALRLSGHLLLGLVRIYSWKVNHLFLDCNRLVTDIRKAFASVPVDLPIEADHAPFEMVTLPETYDLNALELDESYYKTCEPDKHLKPYDQITMTDEIPMEAEQYVAVSISENGWLNLSPQPSTGLNLSPHPANFVISNPQGTHLSSVSRQLEEDILPAFESGFESSLSRQERAFASVNTPSEIEVTHDGNNTQGTPDIENMLCDSDHRSQSADTSGDFRSVQESTQTDNRRQSLSTIPEDASVPEGIFSHWVEKLVTTSPNKLNIPELETFSGIRTPALNPEPVSVRRRKAKKRKHKHAFDRQVILSNMQMKNQLYSTSNIISKRKKLPCSDLDLSKFHRFSSKDDIFCAPLLSRMDATFVQDLEKTYPSSVANNINLATPEKEMVPVMMDSPTANATIGAFSDIERGRAADNIEDLIPQFTPLNVEGFGSESHKEKSPEIRSGQAAAMSSPLDLVPPILETPPFHLTEHNLEDAVVPEPPGLVDSVDEDLNFLNENDSSPGHANAFQVENLSARTRAVAKYFKDNGLELQSDESGHISLNEILEKRSRKQCSRMFFETLVLKSYDFIKVKQEEAYGDILISPTPELLSTKF